LATGKVWLPAIACTATCGNTLLPAPELLELEELDPPELLELEELLLDFAPELELDFTVPPDELEELELLELRAPLEVLLAVVPELEPEADAAPDELELLEELTGAGSDVGLTCMENPGSVAVLVPSLAAITMFE
jgi:hypothetical protein